MVEHASDNGIFKMNKIIVILGGKTTLEWRPWHGAGGSRRTRFCIRLVCRWDTYSGNHPIAVNNERNCVFRAHAVCSILWDWQLTLKHVNNRDISDLDGRGAWMRITRHIINYCWIYDFLLSAKASVFKSFCLSVCLPVCLSACLFVFDSVQMPLCCSCVCVRTEQSLEWCTIYANRMRVGNPG